MGKPNIQTAGGGANTGTAQNWNNFLGGELNSGGFSGLINSLMAGNGYQNYNSFFNNQGGGVAGGVPQVGNPFQTPNYNTQGSQASYVPGQNANLNFQNGGLLNQIGNVGSNAHQVNLSGLNGLANLFIGSGNNQNQGFSPQQSFNPASLISHDPNGGTWNSGAYTPPANINDLIQGKTPEQILNLLHPQPNLLEPSQNANYFNGNGNGSDGSNFGGGLATVPRVGNDPNFMNFLSQGLQNPGSQFSTPTVGTQNLDVNSPYANSMSALLRNDYQRNTSDILNRLSTSGGGLFGTPQAQIQGLLDREALPAIGQAVGNANQIQGNFNQTANLANQQSSLTTQNNAANFLLGNNANNNNVLGLLSNNQLGNRNLDVSQRNVDANNQTSNQQAGLQAALQAAGLGVNQAQGLNQLNLGVAGLLNNANDSANQNYLNAVGLNNNLANNQSNFNLNNASLNNNWMSGLNSLMFNNANANANYGQNAQINNANNSIQNQGLQNQFQLGQGNIGLGLAGQQNQSLNNILSQLFGSYQQSNQIGSPQAQVFQQPSTFSQIFNGVGGLANIFSGLFGQNGAFPNVFGGGNNQGGGGIPSGWNPFAGHSPVGITPSYPQNIPMNPVNRPVWNGYGNGFGYGGYPTFNFGG